MLQAALLPCGIGDALTRLDIHQERTLQGAHTDDGLRQHPDALYPGEYPDTACDLCTEWTASDDTLLYTFTLHQEVKFHDGSAMTSADVKASWEKSIWPKKTYPGKGVLSTHNMRKVGAPGDLTGTDVRNTRDDSRIVDEPVPDPGAHVVACPHRQLGQMETRQIVVNLVQAGHATRNPRHLTLAAEDLQRGKALQDPPKDEIIGQYSLYLIASD